MKKVLVQLVQWILKNKKKLIYGALALFICNICFFGLGGIGMENEVFAADTQSFEDKMITDLYSISALFSKIVYIIMYPLLMFAGKLVDNSLVYGEDFYFDAILWDLWIIVRNIANFALGFLFIFYIFKYLITQDSKHGPKWLIIRALIAGVGIQASWFILAALVDMSTIITYGVGGLPISVLGTEDDNNLKYNPYVLNTVVSIDANDTDTYHIYLSNPSGTGYISTCETFIYSYTGGNKEQVENPWGLPSVPRPEEQEVHIEEELILMPKMVYYLSGKNECYPTLGDRCHIGDQVYKLAGYHFWDTSSLSKSSCTDLKNLQNDINGIFVENVQNYKNYSPGDIENEISDGALLRIGQTGDNFGLDEGNQMIGNEWGSHRIKDILSGSYVGVFGALYGSLLNAGADLRVTGTTSNGIYVMFLNTVLSLGHMVAISIPLIVMLVVFMIRICVLWLAIVLSPIIVLLKTFDFEGDIEKMLDVKFLKYLKVSNLIGIIFSPAVMCFAISMSTVLVRIINVENREVINAVNKPILGGLINLSLAGVGINIGKMLISIIGIAITRFLVWAAVQTSAIGKESKIVGGLKDIATTALGSIPVVPIPNLKEGGVSWVGTNAAKNLPSDISQKIKSKYSNYETVQDLIDPSRVEERRRNNWENAYKDKILAFTPTTGIGWTTQNIDIFGDGTRNENFSNLSYDKQVEVLEAINGLSEDQRAKFGNSQPEITFKDKESKDVKYMFDPTLKKYNKS